MKKYIVRNRKTNEVIGRFDSKKEAADEMMDAIETNNENYDDCDDGYLTPFDFALGVEETKEINKMVCSFEDAKEYLGIENNKGFSVETKPFEERGFAKEDVVSMIKDVNPKHVNALIAMNKLCTIAQAWNKSDGFKPDFSDTNQRKWFPWFVYDKKAAGFVCAYTDDAMTYAHAYYGSRLCFKTSERARQFGNQFIDLWNDVLLFR